MTVLLNSHTVRLQDKAPINASLVSSLKTYEFNRSLLETALKHDKLCPLAIFQGENGLKGVRFQDSRIDLENPAFTKVAEALPRVSSSQKGKVLGVIPSADKPTDKRIAVLFSGGPAAGGHNVLLGICNMLGERNTLLGVRSGPKGLLKGDLFEIDINDLNEKRNTGGFDFLGTDRTKIKSAEQLAHVAQTVQQFELDAIIIIGGDDSNTNAAILAEALLELNCAVIGVPKTIDGDLQVSRILPISFGFDTATKIYAELVGNIIQDSISSRKYWHFVKLMGRAASQVTLEVALQTMPACTLISEEIAKNNWTLSDVVDQITAVVVDRHGSGVHHGVVLIPEGMIEFMPDFTDLIQALNASIPEIPNFAKMTAAKRISSVLDALPKAQQVVFKSLPAEFAADLVIDRDSHGNLQVSRIATEQLIAKMVSERVAEIQSEPAILRNELNVELAPEAIGRLSTFNFASQTHFLGYEGRCGAPSRFDATFTYNLGIVAGALALDGKTGYMAAITDFDSGGRALAIPLTGLMRSETRDGKDVYVIEKALVDTESPAFDYFSSRREEWAKTDCFSSPGPRQFWGPNALQMPMTVALNQGYESIYYKLGDSE